MNNWKVEQINCVNFYLDKRFQFYRLTLPGNLIEDGREVASYDSDSGYILRAFIKYVVIEEDWRLIEA